MIITGSSSSRLTDLRKYTVTNIFANQYVSGGTYSNDGVDYPNSVSGKSVVYYLGGIRYVDSYTGTTGTTFTTFSTIFTTNVIIYTAVTTIHTSPLYTAVTTTYRENGGPLYNAGTTIYSGSTKPYYTGTTIYSQVTPITSNPNFINGPIYQSSNKENIISNPKIYDDVFIVRQELSAFDKNYRLEYMKNLVDLTTYAGGNFFRIVNNT